MFPSGQDPYDPNGARNGGDFQSQEGSARLDAYLEALRPDAPPPKKVMVVRTLMYIGGACGIGLALVCLMALAVPSAEMAEVLEEQAEVAAEQGVELNLTVEMMRQMFVTLAIITGVYGLLSVLLATRIPRRTVGVFWGVMAFQGLAGATLVWSLITGGDPLVLVPLGFTALMMAYMFSREGRAFYGFI